MTLSLGVTFVSIGSEDVEDRGCVTHEMCDATVVLCGDTFNELALQLIEWYEILECAE